MPIKRIPTFVLILILLACAAPATWGQTPDPYNQIVATSSEYVVYNHKESSSTGTGVPAAYRGIIKAIQTQIPYDDWTMKALVTFTLTAPAGQDGDWELELTHGNATTWQFGKAKGEFVDGKTTYTMDPQKKKRPKTITLKASGIRFTCPLPEAMDARQRYGVFKLDSHRFEGCVSELPPTVLAQVREAEAPAP